MEAHPTADFGEDQRIRGSGMHELSVHLLCQNVHTLSRSLAADNFCTIRLSSLQSCSEFWGVCHLKVCEATHPVASGLRCVIRYRMTAVA